MINEKSKHLQRGKNLEFEEDFYKDVLKVIATKCIARKKGNKLYGDGADMYTKSQLAIAQNIVEDLVANKKLLDERSIFTKLWEKITQFLSSMPKDKLVEKNMNKAVGTKLMKAKHMLRFR